MAPLLPLDVGPVYTKGKRVLASHLHENPVLITKPKQLFLKTLAKVEIMCYVLSCQLGE